MKRSIFAFVGLLAVSPVWAADFCTEVSTAAKAIMEARQGGQDAAIRELLLDERLTGDKRTLVLELVKDAYAQPKRDDKEQATAEFGMYWLLKCVRARNASQAKEGV